MAGFTMVFPPDPVGDFSFEKHWRVIASMNVVLTAGEQLLRHVVATGNKGDLPTHITMRAAVGSIVCGSLAREDMDVPVTYGGVSAEKVREKVQLYRVVLFHLRECVLTIAADMIKEKKRDLPIFHDVAGFADMIENDMPASWYRP